MKIFFALLLLLDSTVFAYSGYNDLKCVSTKDETLEFSLVEKKLSTDKFTLTVKYKNQQRVVYQEEMTYHDWQGVSEYKGYYTNIVYGEHEIDGYADLSSTSIHLPKSLDLDCNPKP